MRAHIYLHVYKDTDQAQCCLNALVKADSLCDIMIFEV